MTTSALIDVAHYRRIVVLTGAGISAGSGLPTYRGAGFSAVGTSGTVAPASNYVRAAKFEGARTVYVNLEPMRAANPAFDETVLGRADDVLPKLLNVAS